MRISAKYFIFTTFVFVAAAFTLLFMLPFAQAKPDKKLSKEERENIVQTIRGAYLVEGLGHCGACHTPRGTGLQELGYNSFNAQFLAGATIDGWVANSLRDSTLSKDELKSLLRYGISNSKGVAGPMKDVITHSTQYLTDDDLAGMATYLVMIQNKPEATVLPETVAQVDPDADYLYFTHCSTCHGEQGQGVANVAPKLVGNSNVIAKDPRNLIYIVANGEETPVINARKPYTMPAYKATLKPDELLKVINHIRLSWSNQAPAITLKQLNHYMAKVEE